MTFDAGTGLIHFGHEKRMKLADHIFLVYDQRIILLNCWHWANSAKPSLTSCCQSEQASFSSRLKWTSSSCWNDNLKPTSLVFASKNLATWCSRRCPYQYQGNDKNKTKVYFSCVVFYCTDWAEVSPWPLAQLFVFCACIKATHGCVKRGGRYISRKRQGRESRREREREGGREGEGERERLRERDWERERERDWERDWERERLRERETKRETERERDWELGERERERERERDRERESETEREKVRERKRLRERERERERERGERRLR